MKIMAIDYGDAHTGIAVSDALLTLAGFTTVITAYRPEAVAAEVQNLIAEHGVTELVLGHPLNMDGSLHLRVTFTRITAPPYYGSFPSCGTADCLPALELRAALLRGAKSEKAHKKKALFHR